MFTECLVVFDAVSSALSMATFVLITVWRGLRYIFNLLSNQRGSHEVLSRLTSALDFLSTSLCFLTTIFYVPSRLFTKKTALHQVPNSKFNMDLPTKATFRYLSRGSKVEPSPHLYHLPPLSDFGDVRPLPIIDIKSSMNANTKSPFSLEKQGFTAVRSPSAIFSSPYDASSWNDAKVLKEVYIKEIEELLLKVTGGRKVYTDQVVIRNNFHTEVDGLATSQDDKEGQEDQSKPENEFPKLIGLEKGSGASPAPKVHLDFAPFGARTHLRKYHPKTTELAREIIEAETASLKKRGLPINDFSSVPKIYEGPRWAMFSVWRPLKKVRRDPLAVGDCSTFPKEDYVPFGVLFPSIGCQEGETHREEAFLSYGPKGEGEGERHEWYWIKDQDVDEVLVIQLFDSQAEKEGRGMAGGVMHSSVELEGQDLDGGEVKEPRESCEVRCCVIW